MYKRCALICQQERPSFCTTSFYAAGAGGCKAIHKPTNIKLGSSKPVSTGCKRHRPYRRWTILHDEIMIHLPSKSAVIQWFALRVHPFRSNISVSFSNDRLCRLFGEENWVIVVTDVKREYDIYFRAHKLRFLYLALVFCSPHCLKPQPRLLP